MIGLLWIRAKRSGMRPRGRRRGFGLALVVACVAVVCSLFLAGPARLKASPESAESAATEGRIGFVGRNVFGKAPGVFHVWRVVRASVDFENSAAVEVVVEVELASVDTGSEGRDDHLRTADFFDVERFPRATVRGHSLRSLEPGPAGRPRYATSFDVDLHGIRKTLPGEFEIVQSDPLVVEGGFTLMRTDFGIGKPPSRWNPTSIDDVVPVTFRLALAPIAAP